MACLAPLVNRYINASLKDLKFNLILNIMRMFYLVRAA
jgi:hypothetical protein